MIHESLHGGDVCMHKWLHSSHMVVCKFHIASSASSVTNLLFAVVTHSSSLLSNR